LGFLPSTGSPQNGREFGMKNGAKIRDALLSLELNCGWIDFDQSSCLGGYEWPDLTNVTWVLDYGTQEDMNKALLRTMVDNNPSFSLFIHYFG